MIASGNYCFAPHVVKILREDIRFGWKEFKTDLLDVADPPFKVDMDGALKSFSLKSLWTQKRYQW